MNIYVHICPYISIYIHTFVHIYPTHIYTYITSHIYAYITSRICLWATSAFPFEDKNGLIAKSVHGTRHLNTEIINNVKIAQAASALKKRLVSTTSTPAELVQVLGKHKHFCPNSFQLYTLESMDLDPNKSFFL